MLRCLVLGLILGTFAISIAPALSSKTLQCILGVESAVFILPQPLLGYMLPYKDELRDRAVAADQRRAWDPQEAARHFIDLDQWGDSVFHCMPMNWTDAIRCYHEDSLREHG